ncbi:hypothetical protein FLONG3_9381, partial [Fusarium longipes]
LLENEGLTRRLDKPSVMFDTNCKFTCVIYLTANVSPVLSFFSSVYKNLPHRPPGPPGSSGSGDREPPAKGDLPPRSRAPSHASSSPARGAMSGLPASSSFIDLTRDSPSRDSPPVALRLRQWILLLPGWEWHPAYAISSFYPWKSRLYESIYPLRALPSSPSLARGSPLVTASRQNSPSNLPAASVARPPTRPRTVTTSSRASVPTTTHGDANKPAIWTFRTRSRRITKRKHIGIFYGQAHDTQPVKFRPTIPMEGTSLDPGSVVNVVVGVIVDPGTRHPFHYTQIPKCGPYDCWDKAFRLAIRIKHDDNGQWKRRCIKQEAFITFTAKIEAMKLADFGEELNHLEFGWLHAIKMLATLLNW